MIRTKLFALFAVLAIVGVACSSSTGGGALQSPPVSTPPATSPPASSPPASTAAVAANDQLKFVPATLNVTLGTTVTWTITGNQPHTVTSDTGAWTDSGTLNKGQKFTHTFATAGTFKYHCNIHQGMNGEVVVA